MEIREQGGHLSDSKDDSISSDDTTTEFEAQQSSRKSSETYEDRADGLSAWSIDHSLRRSSSYKQVD